MIEAFRLGGWGMWLTLVCGAGLLAASLRYAVDPHRRHVPLLLGLGAMTVAAGALGFTTGLIQSCLAIGTVGVDERFVTVIGLGESLVNVAFALLFVLVASVATSAGAWRLARRTPDDPLPQRA